MASLREVLLGAVFGYFFGAGISYPLLVWALLP